MYLPPPPLCFFFLACTMKPLLNLNEDLLQYAWTQRHLLTHTLHTSNGEPLERLHPGQLNRDSGPDFFAARIRIGNTLWGGNVEVHLRSSDWFRHGHQFDPAYANVILHVVWEEDEPVCRSNGEPIPTLVLKDLLPEPLLLRYQELMQCQGEIPCETQFSLPDAAITGAWLTRLAIERLESKVERDQKLLHELKGDWEALLYLMLARALGSGANAQPFEWLAKRIPMRVVHLLRSEVNELHALVFGIAGLIHCHPDEAQMPALTDRYARLHHKYNLQTLLPEVWKFKGQRPAGFPPRRLLNFISLLQKDDLLQQVLLADGPVVLQQFFSRILHTERGSGLTVRLMVNAIFPFLFLYGRHQLEHWRSARIPEWEELLPAEENHHTKMFKALGLTPQNAMESQALLQLKLYYCMQHQCLRCNFGNYLLQRASAS